MLKAIKHNLQQTGILLLMSAGLYLLPSSTYAQSAGCNSSCSNSTCQLTLNSNGALSEQCPSGTRYDVDPNCIMNQNAQPGSCLDTMPVSSIKRVSETNCYRANGAGGNPKPRNHLGTDYSASEGTAVTAAADGKVVFAKWMGGGGRVIIIEHEKQCKCTPGNQNAGCDNKYITVYMHLKSFAVTSGTVKRGQVIGKVGGSNYSSATGTSCDWPNKEGGCSPYGPHLHFEIHSGGWEKGYATLKTSIINPLCDDIQTFCGGCSYDVQQCQDKTGTDEWQELSDEAAKTKSEASAVGSMTPEAFGSDSNTVYSALTGCSLERFLPKTEECWFCPLFRVLFNTASTIALNSYNALAGGIANLVIVCFALWISLFVLRNIASIEVKDPRKMIQEFLVQAFRVLVVVLILKVNFFQVMGLTLEPVFNTGMAFTQTITGKGAYNSNNPNQQVSCPTNAEYMQNIIGYDSKSGFSASASGGLPVSMGQNIVCTIKSIQDSIGKMMAYGRQAMCVAWRDKAFIKFIIPSFPYLITALVIYLGSLVLLFAFPWCLVDAVLQMSIAAGLAPAAIGAWAFKITAGYLKKIWDFFMNAMFNFVFLSIIIYIIMTVVDQFMRALNEHAGATTGYDFLVDPINGLAYWGVTGMQLVVVCLMGWVFLDEGANFASHFAKGADMGGIGRQVGGAFAQGAQKVGKTAGKAGLAVGKAGLQVADHFVGSKLRQMRNNYRINKVKNKGTAIKDDNGNIIGYERTRRNLLGQKVTRRVDINEDGKEAWSKSKLNLTAELRNKARGAANKSRLDEMKENMPMYKIEMEGKKILDKDNNVIGYEYEDFNGKYKAIVTKDENGNFVRSSMMMKHRNLMGQEVFVTATRNADGTYSLDKQKQSLRMEMLAKMSKKGSAIHQFAQQHSVVKQKSLEKTNAGGVNVQSDHLMSIREKRDANGVVYQRDIAFNTKTVKYLVNKDGTINMNMLNQISQGTNFSQKTMLEAVAMEVLKARGLSISNKFNDRQVSLDKNGILAIKQVNFDGSTTELNMALGGKGKNQMLTELKTTYADGSYSANIDNGIMKKNISYRNGDASATASYGFNDEYYRRYKYFKPLNGQGQFAAGMDEDAAMFGFNETDKATHAAQIRSGKAQTVSSKYNSLFSQARQSAREDEERERNQQENEPTNEEEKPRSETEE